MTIRDGRPHPLAALKRVLKEWDAWYPTAELTDADKENLESFSQAIEEAREIIWEYEN